MNAIMGGGCARRAKEAPAAALSSSPRRLRPRQVPEASQNPGRGGDRGSARGVSAKVREVPGPHTKSGVRSMKSLVRPAPMRCSAASTKGAARQSISRGVRRELQDRDGWAALHCTVSHLAVIELLCSALGAAAALALKSDALFGGHTPLSLAIFSGNAACMAVLRAHGAPE